MKGKEIAFLGIILLVVLTWSLHQPHDYFTWVLEVLPILVIGPVLIWTYPRFQFSRVTYFLLFLHTIILLAGAHYTYAKVPLFEWFKEWFGWERNYYDRLGHFFQGFVPAVVLREILVRQSVVNGRSWLNVIVLGLCLAFSASYELFEWGVAIFTGTAADDFLGTQGDVWDTQWDMAMAFMGAGLSLWIFREKNY